MLTCVAPFAGPHGASNNVVVDGVAPVYSGLDELERVHFSSRSDVDGEPRVFIQEANTGIFARMQASIAGHQGDFSVMHELDERTHKKVPKKMIGRVLTAKEAKALLKRFGT